MENIYHVVITEVDPETKAVTETHIDEYYKNVTLVADCANRDTMAEVILHDNLIGIASKLAGGDKIREATKFASTMMQILEDKAGKGESSLFRAIMGE